ncbi:glycoside hydrolase family 88 protein [Daldinia bambusicola]|nr:glycoside hydrolase family 88 protein [Daldinia bambusicola]
MEFIYHRAARPTDMRSLSVQRLWRVGGFSHLYLDNAAAKIWGVPPRVFPRRNAPSLHPEYDSGHVYRELDRCTSGFFLGCLYLLLERQHAKTKKTHELGFMIAPWAQVAWELDNNVKGSNVMMMTIYTSRDPDKGFRIAVDDLVSLDTLFWVAAKSEDTRMHDAALCHAKISQRYHIRADYSPAQVVVLDPENGDIGTVFTDRGYVDDYYYSFLETSKACVDYFVEHLPTTAIPLWDFQAPRNEPRPTDTIAVLIARYGMLLIHEIETGAGRPSVYLEHALRIIEVICAFHVNELAKFDSKGESIEIANGGSSSRSTHLTDRGSTEKIVNLSAHVFQYAPREYGGKSQVYFLSCGYRLGVIGQCK